MQYATQVLMRRIHDEFLHKSYGVTNVLQSKELGMIQLRKYSDD